MITISRHEFGFLNQRTLQYGSYTLGFAAKDVVYFDRNQKLTYAHNPGPGNLRVSTSTMPLYESNILIEQFIHNLLKKSTKQISCIANVVREHNINDHLDARSQVLWYIYFGSYSHMKCSRNILRKMQMIGLLQ